jgi:predicted DNA-binding transcriptional regulator YafY
MFDGEERHVTIQAILPLLDTMVERFGNDKQNAIFSKVDDTHFRMTIKVNISDQFFGWLLGFGRRVKLIEPDDVVEQFAAYIKKVGDMYQ